MMQDNFEDFFKSTCIGVPFGVMLNSSKNYLTINTEVEY